MKKAFASLVAAALIVGAGCEKDGTPGGPGASRTGSGNGSGVHLSTPENAFKLDMPTLETSIKQGETKKVNVGISRGKNFSQDVKLDFGMLPQGLKITPANPVIKAGDMSVDVSVEAAKDAALGHHAITVTGAPTTGDKGVATLKLEVKKAD